jgi:squalene-hopene/tetraprenyl-beta-curcumene cyclase
MMLSKTLSTIAPAAVVFGLLFSSSAAAQDDLSSQRSAYKTKVDQSIHRLAEQQLGSALEAAKYLVALVHCHRGYGPSDGPVVRPALKKIFEARNSIGLFGDASSKDAMRHTSAWAYQALHDFDAEGYAADLKKIRAQFGETFELSGDALTVALRPYDAGDFGTAASELEGRINALLGDIKKYDQLSKQIAAAKKKDAIKSNALPWEPFEQKALDWLMAQQKGGVWYVPTPDGKTQPDAGISALGLTALASKPAKERSESEQKTLEAGIKWLKGQQREDGSFSEFTANYVTSAAVMAIHAADLPNSEKAMKGAQRYLLAIQNIEARGYQPSDRDYGSIGYGGDRRGDMSNTQFALEALRLTGLDSSDEAFKKALVYLRRSQNLPGPGSYKGPFRTEDGERKTVRAGDDGGSQYYPGVSYAGYDETADGEIIPRSYGSMTYALLKCYILAGLPKDDPRLQAALKWTERNFTLEVNPGVKPGMPEKTQYQGLFYYYLTMARAYYFGEIDKVGDKSWRSKLRAKLKEEQHKDGFWVNAKNGRWYEQSPIVCTAYSLIALRQ